MIRAIFKLAQKANYTGEELQPIVEPLQEEKGVMGKWIKKKVDAHWNGVDVNREVINNREQDNIRPVDILQ